MEELVQPVRQARSVVPVKLGRLELLDLLGNLGHLVMLEILVNLDQMELPACQERTEIQEPTVLPDLLVPLEPQGPLVSRVLPELQAVLVRREFLDRLVLRVRRVSQELTGIQVHLEHPGPQGPQDQQDLLVLKVLPGCPETLFRDQMEWPDHLERMETQERLDQ